MANVRTWITVTPLGKSALQTALEVAGFGDQFSDEPGNSSWVPYPSAEDVKLYRAGWTGDEVMAAGIETVVTLNVAQARWGRCHLSQFHPSNMTLAALMATFPLPLSGPSVTTLRTQKANTGLHYRDFLLGAFDDDGSPG